jgi:hypothetical protein
MKTKNKISDFHAAQKYFAQWREQNTEDAYCYKQYYILEQGILFEEWVIDCTHYIVKFYIDGNYYFYAMDERNI